MGIGSENRSSLISSLLRPLSTFGLLRVSDIIALGLLATTGLIIVGMLFVEGFIKFFPALASRFSAAILVDSAELELK